MEQKSASMQIIDQTQYAIIHFTGYLEYGLIESLKKELQDNVLLANKHCIINTTNVKNVDSTGFGMMVNLAKKVALQQKKVAIIIVDDFIQKLFTISQCDKVFPIVTSEEEAIAILQQTYQAELSLDEY